MMLCNQSVTSFIFFWVSRWMIPFFTVVFRCIYLCEQMKQTDGEMKLLLLLLQSNRSRMMWRQKMHSKLHSRDCQHLLPRQRQYASSYCTTLYITTGKNIQPTEQNFAQILWITSSILSATLLHLLKILYKFVVIQLSYEDISIASFLFEQCAAKRQWLCAELLCTQSHSHSAVDWFHLAWRHGFSAC